MRTAVLALLTLAAGATAAAADADDQFGYQLHSYNDMRQWPALAARARMNPGFVRLKIDPYYMRDKAFCMRHGFTTDTCFVLNHDKPSTSETYNTSKELPAALAQFPNGVIAICVKYTASIATGFTACNDKEYLARADDMLAEVTTAARAAGITILLDGALSPKNGKCLEDRFQPWNVTWTPGFGRDPNRAATSDEGVYKRYEVLNMNCCEDVVRRAAGFTPPFGKFAARATPFQLWEPSDETSIRAVKETFLSYGVSNKLLFAINQDFVALKNYVTSEDVAVSARDLAAAAAPSRTVLAPSDAESSFAVPSVNLTVWSDGTNVFGAAGGVSVQLGVGNGLKAVAPDTVTADGLLLFTATDGYCYNTETFNKRASPRMCDSTPVPQQNIMTYTYTTPKTLADQIHAVANGAIIGTTPFIMHSCNADVVHGAFGAGTAPVPETTATGFAISYSALEEVNSETCPSVCGCPVARPGAPRQRFTFDVLGTQ